MNGFHLYTSNQMEHLAEALSGVLSVPLADPFATETIVVQSRGMDRWLSLELARRHGICANVRFPFPEKLVRELGDDVLGTGSVDAVFSRESMTFRLFALLGALDEEPLYAQLTRYLADDAAGIRRYQLSRVLADLFDQYQLFRPDLLLAWEEERLVYGRERGGVEQWQAALWRALAEAVPGTEHRAGRLRRLLTELSAADALPGRVCLFGITALPPVYLEILGKLAERTELHLFLMNPCREFWGDIVSPREAARLEKSGDADDLHVSGGNPLLSTLGRQGRGFFDAVECFNSGLGGEYWTDIVPDTLLHRLQADVLDLVDPAGGEPVPLAETDGSILVQACHSPVRELEVLQDTLLGLLDDDPTLAPEDILVMAPDIEVYAPYIGAVFEAPAGSGQRLPFSVADRSLRRTSRMVDAFVALLELAGTRLEAPAVLAVLESEPVMRRFCFDKDELALVRRWVTETNIRWGADAEHRETFGLPGNRQNTWRQGLDRLLLGYAMDDGALFDGILPCAVEGGYDTLGRFAGFVDTLVETLRDLARPRSLSEWSGTLMVLVERFLAADEDTEDEMQRLRTRLSDLEELAEEIADDGEISLEVIRSFIVDALQSQMQPGGFLSGGITFCSMLPMRSIPFRVICLLGMNHDAYPRQVRPRDFDLMGRHPRPGDRSKRDDDLYLFLETLLSARERMVISYVGMSVTDNTALPPSVLVSELLEYLDQRFVCPGERKVHEQIVVKHRLQAFHPDYFSGATPGYSTESLRGARALLAGAVVAPEPEPLPEPDEAFRRVGVDELVGFFRNPARYLLKNRLGIFVDRAGETMTGREPFELDALELYTIRRDYLERGQGDDDFGEILKAQGRLPHGTPGRIAVDDIKTEMGAFAAACAEFTDAGRQSVEVDLDLHGFELYGTIPVYGSHGQVRIRPGGIKGKDLIAAWIPHLVLNLLRPGTPVTLMGRETRGPVRQHLGIPDDPGRLLGDLLALYWQGLQTPLAFFPESSLAAARALEAGKTPDEALQKAAAQWRGGRYVSAEGEDAHYRLCFGTRDVLDDRFLRTAGGVYLPLLTAAAGGRR